MRLRIRHPFRGRGNDFKPTSRRRRLIIVALAVGTSLTIVLSMLAPHARYLREQLALDQADKPACTAGQTQGCVGGTMNVIVVPPPSASAPR